MITYKVTTQEYSVSYKDEEPIGEESVQFEEYKDEREMAIAFLSGYSSEEEAREELDEGEFEELENGIEELLEELESEGGIWWDEDSYDYSYRGRPEPHDGYGASGTYCTYEKVNPKNVLRDKIEHLTSKKEDLLREISSLTSEVKEIESELETLK
jgi:hypothetical protein